MWWSRFDSILRKGEEKIRRYNTPRYLQMNGEKGILGGECIVLVCDGVVWRREKKAETDGRRSIHEGSHGTEKLKFIGSELRGCS
jgi:hypothetical protein